MRLEGTFDCCNFSSHASFAELFISAKLSLFSQLCKDPGLALLAKMQFNPEFVLSFCLNIFIGFPQKS